MQKTNEKSQYFNELSLLTDNRDKRLVSENSKVAFFGEFEEIMIPQRRTTP